MRYRFDGFEIDTRRYELRRDGALRHVEPLVFDLLHFLARHPGRVLTRDEIVQQVWQGRNVSDATIAGCVKAARRALGDSGEEPTYIRTVRGRGFEFTAQVTAEEPAVPAAEAAPVPEPAAAPPTAPPPCRCWRCCPSPTSAPRRTSTSPTA